MANVQNVLTATDIHDVTTEKNGVLGQTAMTADGRVYRYAKAGGALAAGDKVAASATAAKSGTASAAYNPGAQMVETNITVSDADVNKYDDSVMTVANAEYLVMGITKNGKISLADKLDVAVTKSAAVKVTANKFNGLTKASTGATIGVVEVAVPSGSYFWLREEAGTAA